MDTALARSPAPLLEALRPRQGIRGWWRPATRLAAIFLLLVLAVQGFATDVPYLTGRVTDEAEILSAQTREKLGSLLKRHEDQTDNQIAVLTVRSLDGESVEQYALDVFNTWNLGRKGKDNGVLLLVAPQERRMRIEVGYGLEGTLTDVAAGRIIRNAITPRFKESNFDQGLMDGVQAIVDTLEGKEPAAAGEEAGDEAVAKADTAQAESFFEGPELAWPERILIGAFIFGIIGLFTVIGVLTPGVGWFLYLFLIPFWAMFPIVVVGTRGTLYLLVTYLVAYPVSKLLLSRTDWYAKAARDIKTKGSAAIGGFTIGSSGGTGPSSWSSHSSGGFSGGGGSSGGGGASGSW